ncbi:MAG: 23S rRNA (adenine(2503)-C(2))-methyltransferase [Candidatus Moranbacteria bacterium RBG_19FT_COMBO_42_6]|nr:MAG: 23S rRNA (adenine(2503)-C(2))-methyltransferase [Candidatus Moranbacteria bacterium RBG_19FT_COMBO_42_6]
MDPKKLEEILKEYGEPKFRLEQIKKAVYKDGVFSFSEISTLSKDLRERLEKEMKILSFSSEKVLMEHPARNAMHNAAGGDGQSIKALLKLSDGNLIETVLISPKPGLWSACISCQVGCAMGCRFCATGKMGFIRNLTAEEITDQVLFWRQYLKKFQISNFKSQSKNYDVSNIVYMGMGEPFMNWQEVKQSLKDLTNPELFGFGSRSISVSTSGIGEGIENFGKEFPQVNLAISLHFASDKKRGEFMPVNNKYNLEKIKKALRKYFENSNRKVFIEYIMLEGINDSREDALDLANYLKAIGKVHLLHVNLIRYNTTSADLSPSSGNTAQKFKNYLLENNIDATIRKSLGEEIQGACGQLAGK